MITGMCRILAVAGLQLLLATAVRAGELYFVDASSKMDDNIRDPALILKMMDENGVSRTLLASRRKDYSDQEVLDLARHFPERIVPIVRLMGRDYRKATRRYFSKLDADAESGRFYGFGDALIYHREKHGENAAAPEYSVPLSDERITKAVAHARKNRWPFIVHIEFKALPDAKRRKLMRELKDFLASNRDLPVVLIHVAQLGAEEAEPLLAENANLYLMVSHTNPAYFDAISQKFWQAMFDGDSLTKAWTEVAIKFPDRLVFALDNVGIDHWYSYPKQMKLWRAALARLPSEVAHAIAHGNAERLWHLSPLPPPPVVSHDTAEPRQPPAERKHHRRAEKQR